MDKIVIPTPEFSLKLPISGETVKYRPFLVREEKLLLMLKEAKDNALVIDNLKKIMQLCILDDTSIANISYADFEFLFLNMRVRSIGETIDLETECESCGKKTPCVADLNQVTEEMEAATVPDKTVMLTNEIGVIVKPLELRNASAVANLQEKDQLKIIAAFIDKIFTENDVSSFTELSTDHQAAFVDSLSMKHISMIMERVAQFPRLKADIEYTCTHCQHKGKMRIEGLDNFFI